MLLTGAPLVWTLIALATALALVGLAGRIDAARRRAPALPPPSAPTDSPQVTVLLPCRDEESNVGACLDTLLGQTVPVRVVVVDDGSTDRTAAIVREQAQGSERVALVEAGELPAGWRGKVHALHRGLESLGPEVGDGGDDDGGWVLSTDADTRHHRHALGRALAAAREHRLDAVSLAGRQVTGSLGESLLTPLVYGLLDALLPDWCAAARGDGPAIANGQYLLVRRRLLEASGGFAAIRGEAIDDLALARSLRAAGGRTGFFRAAGCLRVRMYAGAHATFRGWRRNLSGLFGRRPALVASAVVVCLAPPLFATGLATAGLFLPAALVWTGAVAAEACLRGGDRPWLALLWPLGPALLATTLLASLADARRGRTAAWKGRTMES